jgi:hypothetical protein
MHFVAGRIATLRGTRNPHVHEAHSGCHLPRTWQGIPLAKFLSIFLNLL